MIYDPTDEYLILRIKNGDIDKAGLIYDRYFKIVYRYFYKLTHNKMESEDLAQNVFIRLIRFVDSYKQDYQFVPWMYKIARNIFIDYCNDKSRFSNSLDTIRKENTGDDFTDCCDENLEKFYAAFNHLPIDYQQLLILSRYQGLTYKQIGIVLNLNEKAVKQKAFRALEKLRKEYNNVDK